MELMDMEIPEEEFEKMDRNMQMVLLYRTQLKRDASELEYKKETQDHRKGCADKFYKMRNGKRVDKGWAAIFGMVGGAIAGLFK